MPTSPDHPSEAAAGPASRPPVLPPNPLAAGERNIPVDEARAQIRATMAGLPPISGTETLPLTEAVGRILADDLLSPMDVPPHDNSAMDGFAFDGSQLRPSDALSLVRVGTVMAGALFDGRLGPGECLRIMTGAVMPAGADTVVPLELCTVAGDTVLVKPGVLTAGENRRRRGEDLALGRPAVRAGRVLRPADLGLIASLGFTTVTARRRLKVALFSTGDEVVAPGQPLPEGAIYDSNRFSLTAALQRIGCEVIDLGLVRDDPSALQATLEAALAQGADAVVTSGGVSAGDADHTRDVLASLGEVAFWKVAMRPGRPFAFGPIGDGTDGGRRAMLFGLPGNPVAALVTFYAFARDALLQAAGAVLDPMPRLAARSADAIRKRPGRTEFQRAIVSLASDGVWQVAVTGSQGAGVLRSMAEANALLVLHHDQASVAAGERVEVWLFDGLV
jgi:molybdopterin molybdotransferase